MRIIELEQGSPEWFAWRKTVITATDCSAIRGSSPWNTAYKCWQRKTGLVEEQASNEAMERGKRLEPEARAQFIERHGIDVVPAVVESSEFGFLGASLDGISQLGNVILEVKCGGTKLHDMASRGEIPQYYKDQMQHQLLVTGAAKCFYYSYDGINGICIEVYPDADFAKSYVPVARAFWKCVAFNEAPPLRDSDYKDMSDNISWKGLAASYKNICEQIKYLEERKEVYRKGLLDLCGDENCLGEGLKVSKIVTRGRVDYDMIPELNGVNLDRYRKGSTTIWKVCVV